MSKKTKFRSFKLTQGFYAVRYVADGLDGPIAIMQWVPAETGVKFQGVGAELDGALMLSQDSPLAVVNVQGGAATVIVSLLNSDEEKPAGVQLEVDRIVERLPKKLAPSSSLVYLSGHVEWKGDLKVPPNVYLGAKNGKVRIEGFSVNWLKKNKNVDVKYGCTFGEQRETSTALGGGFVGSRGQSAPITSLWMKLEGSAADQYDLQYTAVFSKSGAVPGRQENAVSGTDLGDYLVGLWVSVENAGSEAQTMPPATGRKINELKTFRA